jgi:hypothetical protein
MVGWLRGFGGRAWSRRGREDDTESHAFVRRGGVCLFCTVGLDTVQAASLLATENGATAVLSPDATWDVMPFHTIGAAGGIATGKGAYTTTAGVDGSALVVLTEGPGGANSNWLLIQYSGPPGSPGREDVDVSWNSEDDLGNLALLPENATPEFLAGSGGVQDVTALLMASQPPTGSAFPTTSRCRSSRIWTRRQLA